MRGTPPAPALRDPGTAGPGAPRLRWLRRRAVRAAGLLAVAAIGAAGAVAVLGLLPVRGGVGPGELEVRVVPSLHGITAVEVPPLGRVEASTHDAPTRVEARIAEVDLEQVQRVLLARDPAVTAARETRRDLGPLLRRLAVKAMVGAAAAGALLGAVVPRRRWGTVVAGALGGVAATGLLLMLTWRSYDPDGFDQPHFEGALERAPAVIEAGRRHVASLQAVRGRVEVLATQVADLYRASSGTAVPGEEGTAILHISDVHLNPLAVEVAFRLARSFSVDAILDTGDLTSFGLPVEGRITELLAESPVPYYLVPGNHDSPENRATLVAAPAVRVLDGEVATVDGVAILGVADPTFTATNEISTAQANAHKRADAARVRQLVLRHRPDVLAVHDATHARAALGDVPVVVAGHAHRRSMDNRQGTEVLVVGSAGAGGLEAFTDTTPLPYEAQILRFRGGRLVAVDYLVLDGVEGEFVLDRRLVEAEALDPVDGAVEDRSQLGTNQKPLRTTSGFPESPLTADRRRSTVPNSRSVR